MCVLGRAEKKLSWPEVRSLSQPLRLGFLWPLMDACHRYGQKQEGACQLHDPHKTEQEILAGNERGRDGCSSLLSPLKTVPLTYPVESEAAGGRKEGREEGKQRRQVYWNAYYMFSQISCAVRLPLLCTPVKHLYFSSLLTGWFIMGLSRCEQPV